MRPPGTPVAATSAANASRASSSRPSAASAASARARVNATERAELEERPEPGGTVESIMRCTPGMVMPCRVSASTTPATNRPQEGSTVLGSVLPSTVTATVPGSCAERARTRSLPSGVADTEHARSIASGRT